MHRWWKAFFLSVILACAAAGCLDYEEEITLDTKCAGVIRIHYFTDETTAQLLEGEDSPFALDQKAIEERLEGSAAKLRSVDVYSADGQRHAMLEIEFAGLEKLAGNWPFESRTFSLSRRDDGLYVYRTVIGMAADEETGQDGSATDIDEDEAAVSGEDDEVDLTEEEAASPELEATMEQAAADMTTTVLEGHSFKYVLNLPGEIVEASEGGIIEGRRVTWEIPLAELEGKDRIVLTATFKQ